MKGPGIAWAAICRKAPISETSLPTSLLDNPENP